MYRLTSHRRTLTETDIVSFVNLVGLHEPPFIDMHWVSENMPESHARRFAPAPLLISLGMGLVATLITPLIDEIREKEGFGQFHGMVGLQAAVRNPAYPGDTLQVAVEARIDRKTSHGQTLLDLEHVLTNQDDEIVVTFTEKLLFESA